MGLSQYHQKWSSKSLPWLYPEGIQIGKQMNANISEEVKQNFIRIGEDKDTREVSIKLCFG